MKVMTGWSAEMSNGVWAKHDVTIEEEDFSDCCREYGLQEVVVSPQLKYQLMEGLAMKYLIAHIGSRFPEHFKPGEMQEKLQKLSAKEAQIVGKINAASGG
jgi:hypothetical protein